MSFGIGEGTKFLSKDKLPLDFSEFSAGNCVKIHGHKEGADNIADEVRKSSDCN